MVQIFEGFRGDHERVLPDGAGLVDHLLTQDGNAYSERAYYLDSHMSKSNNAQMHNFTDHSTQIPYRSLSNLGLVVAVL